MKRPTELRAKERAIRLVEQAGAATNIARVSKQLGGGYWKAVLLLREAAQEGRIVEIPTVGGAPLYAAKVKR